jgi:hypothetical protein
MDASICTSCDFTFYLNGTIKHSWPHESCTIPVAGNDTAGGTIEVSTTPKDLPIAEVTPGGICAFRNLSKVPAEVIHLRRTYGGHNFVTIKPGEFFVFRLGLSEAPKILSEQGTPLLRYFMADD